MSDPELRRFHNALRILTGIDRSRAPGVFEEPGDWNNFLVNPFLWFIRASDADAEKIWKVIEARNTKNPSKYEILYPRDEWHEDIGDVLWWRLPIDEAPYCGSMLDTAFEDVVGAGYYTHFSLIPKVRQG